MPNQDDPVDNKAAPTSDAPVPTTSADSATPSDSKSSDSVVVDPSTPDNSVTMNDAEVYPEVARKISEAHNILIALSSDPSVDEMAAAIGLSLFLDKLGKRATAIYSGSTPNALEFLKPEDTFESTADALQDFVIAISKEKADHLRYKLDGDFVKIYITPYKTRISEGDLDYSYGDFNVDLVLALDVANGIDLDKALREHGRIMHNASVINITSGNPGKFGEIEWSNKKASSVSEMIAKLLYSTDSKDKISKEEATAFLTGIVAATNRFSNAKTTPDTMQVSSKLMESGANQQLISKNITPDIENEIIAPTDVEDASADVEKLDIRHGNEKNVDETKEVSTVIKEEDTSLLDDLKAAEASLANAGAEAMPDLKERPIKIDSEPKAEPGVMSEVEPADSSTAEASKENEIKIEAENEQPAEKISDVSTEQGTPVAESIPASAPAPSPEEAPPTKEQGAFLREEPTMDEPQKEEPQPSAPGITGTLNTPEKVIAPPSDFAEELENEGTGKYGKMLEDALNSIPQPIQTPAPTNSPNLTGNPAAMNAPAVASNPEINGVPSINYMPMPGEEILPPPPAPSIDMGPMPAAMPTAPTVPVEAAAAVPEVSAQPTAPTAVTPIQPAMTPPEPTPEPLGSQPAMQDQVYTPQAVDPGAFKIPGM